MTKQSKRAAEWLAELCEEGAAQFGGDVQKIASYVRGRIDELPLKERARLLENLSLLLTYRPPGRGTSSHN